ncbi:hypothetical protein GCM10023093_23400 [Nemorincola caseinilytica]|uniref:Ferritin-like metal-binding protein YciE n=2 Tax=Nemorincola caseinilytica TaxID=2054315 RepID=A0ABP8NHH6_9BACT
MAIALPDPRTDRDTFRHMFLSLLKDIYGAEQHFAAVLQRMYSAATTGLVQNTLKDIRHASKRHLKKLERVFTMLGSTAEARKNASVASMEHDTEKLIAETPEHSTTRDAGLILFAQRMEQYGIATYNDLVYAAHALGHSEAACILEDILREREYTDIELADIADTRIHPTVGDAPLTDDDH